MRAWAGGDAPSLGVRALRLPHAISTKRRAERKFVQRLCCDYDAAAAAPEHAQAYDNTMRGMPPKAY